MFQRARTLLFHVATSPDPLTVAELANEAYVITLNALAMLDPKQAWFTCPVTDSEDKVRMRMILIRDPLTNVLHSASAN